MSASLVVSALIALILNILVSAYFFGLCGNVKAIRKDLCKPEADKDFYNRFLKFISQGRREEAVEVIREHFWDHSSWHQTSITENKRSG